MYKKKCLLCWKDRIMLRQWKSKRRMCLIKQALCSIMAMTHGITEHEFMPGSGREEDCNWRQLWARDGEKGKFLASYSSLIMISPSFCRSGILLGWLDALWCPSGKILFQLFLVETRVGQCCTRHSGVSDPMGWPALALPWLKISWCNLFKRRQIDRHRI